MLGCQAVFESIYADFEPFIFLVRVTRLQYNNMNKRFKFLKKNLENLKRAIDLKPSCLQKKYTPESENRN